MSSRRKFRTGKILARDAHIPEKKGGVVDSFDVARRKERAMEAATESKSPASFPKTTTRCTCSPASARADDCFRNCRSADDDADMLSNCVSGTLCETFFFSWRRPDEAFAAS